MRKRVFTIPFFWRVGFIGGLFLGPCCAHAEGSAYWDMIQNPKPFAFSVCHGHTCARLDTVSLDHEKWQRVRNIFSIPAADPESERRYIAEAVALLETLVGPLTGTAGEKGKNLDGAGQDGQMDCIDESLNTTTYLKMLHAEGLLRWHKVESRSTRGWFIFGWPHSTAVIREAQSDRAFAVDSWFEDNGVPPHIMPLDVWKSGWRPAGK